MPAPSAIDAAAADGRLNCMQEQISQVTTMLGSLNSMTEQRLAATLAADVNKKVTALSTSAKATTAGLARKTQTRPATRATTATSTTHMTAPTVRRQALAESFWQSLRQRLAAVEVPLLLGIDANYPTFPHDKKSERD